MKLALALSLSKKKTPAFKERMVPLQEIVKIRLEAPHGMDSKQRRNYKYRSSLVRVGHGKVAKKLEDFTLRLEKSWFTTLNLEKLTETQQEELVRLLAESVNRYTEQMNWELEFSTEEGCLMQITNQKRLVIRLLKCGVNRVWVNPDYVDQVASAVQTDDIREFIVRMD